MISPKQLEIALSKGEDAFWQAVASSFPEVRTGDVSPHSAVGLQRAMKRAINDWLELNAFR